MRGEPVFLGVYVKVSDSDSTGGATRWHAWGLPDGDFLLREAPQDQPGKASAADLTGEVQRLGVEEFFTDYRVFAAFSSKSKPAFPENAPGSGAAPQARNAAAQPETPGSGSAQAAASSQAAPRPGQQAQAAQSPRAGAAGPNSPANPASPASSGAPGAPGGSAGQSTLATPAQPGSPANSANSAGPANSAGRSAPRAMPGSDHTDLVTFLTQGLGESGGKDYVVVRGKPEEDGVHSNHQAQELIFLDEDDGSLAVPMDEEEIARVEQGFRTEFSLALIRLKSKRGDALQNLEQLAKNEGPFAREHKFMFSDCGTALRKRNLYVLAQQFHERARELAPDDEHVLFNLARVLYECGKTDRARECLALSVEMAPDFQAGKDFLTFLDGAARF